MTSKDEGQGAFLVKAREDREEGDPFATPFFPLPSATALWEGGSISMLTCSDKLLLWQHLGFQGGNSIDCQLKNGQNLAQKAPKRSKKKAQKRP